MNKKHFNILFDTPPDEFGGVKIRTSFKQVLEFFRLVDGVDDKTDDEKLIISLKILDLFFYHTPKFDEKKVWDFLTWYITRGEEQESGTGAKVFDWDIDAGRVYAAFLQSYGIDLLKNDLHWWTFKDLFESIPTGTKLLEVIDIRGRKLDPKAGRKEKAELARAKATYSLNDEYGQFPI